MFRQMTFIVYLLKWMLKIWICCISSKFIKFGTVPLAHLISKLTYLLIIECEFPEWIFLLKDIIGQLVY